MKPNWKFLLNHFTLLALFLPLLTAPTAAQQQRPRRANEYARETVLAAGARVLPQGYVLILRMENRLDSAENRPSDRFYARLEETVVDERGAMILPKNLLVIGHVIEVTPAQSRRRSGLIEIGFDKIVMADGRELPLRGFLTSADPEERQKLQLDEDGLIEGGSQKKRNTVFIGGGAATGAVIGAIAGGAALGAGVGAAVGLVAVLLSKGKEAIVEPDTLIGLELTAPLDLTQRGIVTPPTNNSNNTTKPPTNNNNNSNSQMPPINPPSTQDPNTPAPALEPQPLKINFAQAERVSGGSILVVVTAETPTTGWSPKVEQKAKGDLLEIWVNGMPPAGRSNRVVSHPTVTATEPDPNGNIRRILIHGASGDRLLNLPPRTNR